MYIHLTTEYQNMEAKTDRTVWNSKPTDPLVQLEKEILCNTSKKKAAAAI